MKTSDMAVDVALRPMPATASAMTPARLRWVMLLVTGAMFMEILDGSIIVTALPSIARSFGEAPMALELAVSAYMLAVGVFIPASGWVADRFGARSVLGAAIVLFTVSSLLCGSAGDMHSFVALRILQGVAGAMMVPVGRLVIMHHTPREKLMDAMASLIWPALIAPVLGPPLGGLITTHLGWRWIFYLNLPLGLLALVACLWMVPSDKGERRPFDWPGFVLCGASTFALLLGFDRITAQPDMLGAGLIALGLALGVATLNHFRRAASPMLGLEPWSIQTFRAAQRGGALMRMSIGAVPFLLPLMFQIGFGYNAFHSGLLVLAVFAGNLGIKTITTPILRRFGMRNVLVVNGVISAILVAACALLQPDTAVPVAVALLAAGGCARSMQFTSISSMTFADVPRPQMTHANGLSNTLMQLTMAAGITLGALGVRIGHALAPHLGWSAPGADYRFAFLLVAAVSLMGVLDMVRLPRNVAEDFVKGS
ncbi:MFS transporter [Novosphingobium terrae]|uniref:MFS transporter n=1 Tax=Novosphingobium terrae TaxID=2726189 RepID=UPI00197E59FA|nr:MFS transporter [Novosphingobium terrae]